MYYKRYCVETIGEEQIYKKKKMEQQFESIFNFKQFKKALELGILQKYTSL